MDKLNKKDIDSVKNTLKEFITKTAGCEDAQQLHQQALHIFGKAFSEKPSLIKQAASAYNSNKSIFKLSDETTANTDFGLLNPDQLYKDLVKTSYNNKIEKAAGANLAVRFYVDEEHIQKVANTDISEEKVIEEETMSPVALDNYMKEVMDDRDRVLIKSATRRDICSREVQDYYDAFCRSFDVLSKEAKARVAKNIISVYPVDGAQLIDKYKADHAMVKIANFVPTRGTHTIPTGDIYTKAQNYMVAEFAKNQAERLFKEAAANTLEFCQHIPGLYKLYKTAANGMLPAAFSGAILSEPLKEVFNPQKIDDEAAYQKTLSARLINQLREIEAQNVLVDMYSEPFIASYPADEIESATIQAMQMLPAEQRIHPRKHVSLLKTWVADILGRGGNMSSADSDKILNATTAFSRVRPAEVTNLTKDIN